MTTNFAAIAWIDTYDLAASLRTRMGLFKSAHGTLTLAARIPRPNDPGSFGYVKEAGVASGKWPELKIALDRLTSMGEQQGGVELGRVELVMLHPRACSPWSGSDSAFDHGRLLLRGNPGLVWYGAAETWMPTIGVLTLVNRRVPNSAVNMGEAQAIWLAADFRKVGANAKG